MCASIDLDIHWSSWENDEHCEIVQYEYRLSWEIRDIVEKLEKLSLWIRNKFINYKIGFPGSLFFYLLNQKIEKANISLRE